MKHLIIVFVAIVVISACSTGSQYLRLIVGTYTTGKGHGIYSCRFNTKNAEYKFLDSAKADNPSFLAAAPGTDIVYAVNESGARSGLSAFAADRKNGTMQLLGCIDNPGSDPCHIAVEPAGRYVVTADYSSGTVTVYSAENRDVKRQLSFSGSGPDSLRQRSPHIHCVVFSPSGTHLFATDLGSDRIYVMQNTTLAAPVLTNTVSLEPGSGPRQLIFNRSGDRAYLISELSGKVTVFSHKEGQLSPIQSVLADTCLARGSAHIALSADGKFLYVSTRLKGDGIVTYSIDPTEGKLTRTGFQPTGNHPRHFLITPDDRWILVSCKNENHIEIYRRNTQTGLPEDTGKRIAISQPVCILAL